MRRDEFEYLYIHASGLAELALHQLALDIEREYADQPPMVPPTEEERRAMEAAYWAETPKHTGTPEKPLFPGIPNWDSFEYTAEDVLRVNEEIANPTTSAAISESELDASPLGDPFEPTESGELNFALYLENVYAASTKAQIAAHVDAGLAKIDMPRLESLLATLPGHLTPLTKRLEPDELAQWLALEIADTSALGEIVTLIRALDPVF